MACLGCARSRRSLPRRIAIAEEGEVAGKIERALFPRATKTVSVGDPNAILEAASPHFRAPSLRRLGLSVAPRLRRSRRTEIKRNDRGASVGEGEEDAD